MNYTKHIMLLISGAFIGAAAYAAVPAQSVALNFQAASVIDVKDPTFIPPSQIGAVGPTQYVMSCAGIYRSFNKFTGLPDGALNIDETAFYGGFGGGQVGLHSGVGGDTSIQYNRFLNRWFFATENGATSDVVIVISRDAILTEASQYDTYVFPAIELDPEIGTDGFTDYTIVTFDQNVVYFTVQAVDNDNNFVGATLVVIPNSAVINGTVVEDATIFLGLNQNVDLFETYTVGANNFDPNPQFGYMVYLPEYLPSSPSTTQMQFQRILNADTTPTLADPVLTTIPITAYSPDAPHKGNLFGDLGFLQTLNNVPSVPQIRNKQLYLCTDSHLDINGNGDPNGDRVGVRWWQFDLTGDATGQGLGTETATTVPALVQSGTLYDNSPVNPKFYFNSSMMTNKNHDMVVSATVSGADDYIDVIYAGRKASDPLGTLRNPVYLTHNNETTQYTYNYGPNAQINTGGQVVGQRWGDASSVNPDPINDLDLWATQESNPYQNGWGIQATKLIPA